MTNYRQYEAADFVADASFQAWVQHGTGDEFWSGWLADNPDKAACVATARELVLRLRFHSAEVDPSEMELVMANINRDLGHVKKNNTSIRRLLLFILPAAAASLILGILFLWPSSPEMVTVSTTFAETKQVVLPDGSSVVLNGNSRLRYQQRWKASEAREVSLEGEAFFKVTSRPAGLHPKFRVHTPLANVDVLGTAFNVNNRRNEVTVVLQEGKVKMNDMQLTPGELAVVSAKGTERRRVDAARFSAWTQHRMVFDNQPLSEIAAILQDTYGYTIAFRKAGTSGLKLTGSYPVGRLDLLIAAVQAVHGVKVEQQGTKITFE